MTDPVVEKVAEAIWQATYRPKFEPKPPLPDYMRQQYRRMAKAAIEAMPPTTWVTTTPRACLR